MGVRLDEVAKVAPRGAVVPLVATSGCHGRGARRGARRWRGRRVRWAGGGGKVAKAVISGRGERSKAVVCCAGGDWRRGGKVAKAVVGRGRFLSFGLGRLEHNTGVDRVGGEKGREAAI